MFEMAFLLDDAQQRAHGGVTGGIGQRFMDLRRRGLAARVDDVHDLTLPPAEMVAVSIRHAKFLAHPNGRTRKLC
jgi:hypothetical protein